MLQLLAGKHKGAKQAAQLLLICVRAGVDGVLPHGLIRVDGVMFLREVTNAQTVAADDATFTIGAFHTGQQFQQGGLTCTVVAENDHPRAFVDSEVNAHENL